MTVPAPSKTYTLDEYLEMESHSQTRHRFDNGKITPMPYTSEQHSLITSNLIRSTGNLFLESDCRTYGSDRMLFVPACDQTFYPDMMIVCGPSKLYTYKDKMQATLNPVVLIEVLSESTQVVDRTRKWDCYRQIESLRQYILVAQEAISVEVFSREDATNRWAIDLYTGDEAEVPVQSVQLPIKEIYRNISFKTEKEQQ